jgi:hypothetical protein
MLTESVLSNLCILRAELKGSHMAVRTHSIRPGHGREANIAANLQDWKKVRSCDGGKTVKGAMKKLNL